MANQTELLNVSDEMKLDDERQSFEGLECGEGLCSSSSDTTEELYSGAGARHHHHFRSNHLLLEGLPPEHY